jgi:hypothetical protein
MRYAGGRGLQLEERLLVTPFREGRAHSRVVVHPMQVAPTSNVPFFRFRPLREPDPRAPVVPHAVARLSLIPGAKTAKKEEQMDCTRSTLNLGRRLQAGATIIAAGVCLLVSARSAVFACDIPFRRSNGSDPDMVDAIAASTAVMPPYGAALLCVVSILPADIYWEVKRPQDVFGTHAGGPVCTYSSQLVADSIHFAVRYPLLGGKKVLWDIPRSAAGGGAPAS